MTLLAVSGCAKLQASSAIDLVKPDVANHAEALAGDDVELMRETGLSLIAKLAAVAGWDI